MTIHNDHSSPEPEMYAQQVSEALFKTDFTLLKTICDEIIKRKKTGHTIFTVGNGGSAATASHLINDLIKGCRIGEREGFRACCLNDPNVVVTCLANDFCYEDIYSIFLRTVAKQGDLLIVFSGSGKSQNILRACQTAQEIGITIIGFGGRDGGKMKDLCDYCLLAPTYSMEQLEDLHILYVHSLICRLRMQLKNVWDIEVVHYPRKIQPKFAIFDFDGTVSLLREGWQPIMYRYFTEELLKCPKALDPKETENLVRDFVDRLTGKQTIFQCMGLCEEITKSGGTPQDPLQYKEEYLRRLMLHIANRIACLKNGGDPSPYLVPGIIDILNGLSKLGVKCYLTSGTDESDVFNEAKLLGIANFFESIHGATDVNSTVCSKEQVLNDLLNSKSLKGNNLLAFGDGYIEIELTKKVGGYAVAVATNESKHDTSVDEWKRERLLKAGADCVIPDFSNSKRLIDFLFGR